MAKGVDGCKPLELLPRFETPACDNFTIGVERPGDLGWETPALSYVSAAR